MICYFCLTERNAETRAVAICQSRGVAMCLEHLRELKETRPGGTSFECPHVLPQPAVRR